MNCAPLRYKWGRPYDDNLPLLVDFFRARVDSNDNEQDFRVLIVGAPGSGKSSLTLWIKELFEQEEAAPGRMALSREDYARAVKEGYGLRKKGRRYVSACYDEVDLMSTEIMSKWTRSVMTLFGKIRQARMLHIWCVPKPGKLPSDFYDELFNALIYIADSSKERPRVYYAFLKRHMDAMRRKAGTRTTPARINLTMLAAQAKKHAFYEGCFTKYDGPLWEPYMRAKEEGVKEAVDDFLKQWVGSKAESPTAVARRAGIPASTFKDWVEQAAKSGFLKDGVDYVLTPGGRRKITHEGAEKLLNSNGNRGGVGDSSV